MNIKEIIKTAQGVWKETPSQTLVLLKEARQLAKEPKEVLMCEQELLVYGEWNERRKAGMPMYHSLNVDDVGFRFQNTTPYLEACHAVGGDYLGYAAFVEGRYKTAQKIWAQSETICRHFALEADPTDETKWPDVHRFYDMPCSHPDVWLGCDGVYFEKFGAALALSLREWNTPFHVHLMDPTPKSLELAKRLAYSLSAERCNQDRIYYHAARLKRFADDLERFSAPMWMLDVDAVANRSPINIPLDGVSLRVRPGRIEPWNQFNASMVGADPSALAYLRSIVGYLARRKGQWFWGIDQLALFCAYHGMEDKPNIRALTEKECDYDYQPEGVIWCNSGVGKFADSDPSRAAYYERFEALKGRIGTPSNSEPPNDGGGAGRVADSGVHRANRVVHHPKSLQQALEWVEEAALTAKIKDLEEPPPFRQRKIGKFVYLPVEIAGRELAAKCKLGAQLVKRGFKVVVGAAWNLGHHKFTDLPPGVILFKTMNSLDSKLFWQAGCAGHIIAVLNEELISLVADETVYRANCHKWSMHLADAIFAHGEEQAKIYRRLAAPSRVYVTGHPRAADKHGGNPDGDIVVCSNTATINSMIDTKEYIRRAFEIMGCEITPELVKYQQDAIRHEWENRDLLLQTARLLREKYGPRFKFRPHPAERRETYEAEFGDCLDESQSFSERLKDTALVVFASGCGTGLEAYNAGVPSIRLGGGGFGLSREVGIPAEDANVAVAACSVELCDPRGSTGAEISRHFAPCTVAVSIESLWRKNQYPMDFDIETAWKQRPPSNPFIPGEWHLNKMAGATKESAEALSGCKAKEIDWCVWELS